MTLTHTHAPMSIHSPREQETPEKSAQSPPREVAAWLLAPYEDRMQVKEIGGRWDPDQKKWYVPLGVDTQPFIRWLPAGLKYLTCPYSEKDEAKALGARWGAPPNRAHARRGTSLVRLPPARLSDSRPWQTQT